MPLPLCPWKDWVSIVKEAGWAPGLLWTGGENIASLGFDPQTVQPVEIRIGLVHSVRDVHTTDIRLSSVWYSLFYRIYYNS
jgi:hypothetical protein